MFLSPSIYSHFPRNATDRGIGFLGLRNMSTGHARQRSNSNKSSSVRSHSDIKLKPPTPSITPGVDEFAFEPSAATASFLLYAQRNVILCVHHDTLAVERRFTRHREDVSWISVDNVSEKGAGRLVVSYDAGSTAIVWDLLTGNEVARFASYEQIRVATWMKNGNVAFGESPCCRCCMCLPLVSLTHCY